MHSFIRPNANVVLRLPSGVLKTVELKPNTTINIGKFGTFPANLLFGRPYYLTFELLDKEDGKSRVELRLVPAAELHAEALGSDYATPAESREDMAEGGVEFDIVGDDGEVIMRSNRLTIDDPARQTLTMEEIEELKRVGTGSGKEIIEKIMASHLALEEKTSFSLAKYTLRKSRKYMKRFTVLPLDVGMLTEFICEREGFKIMELRQESLGLIGSWANIHCGASSRVLTVEDDISQVGGGRWLVVDDTGGLVVAALAEKMGILYPPEDSDDSTSEEEDATEAQTSTSTKNGPPSEKSTETILEKDKADLETTNGDAAPAVSKPAEEAKATDPPQSSEKTNPPEAPPTAETPNPQQPPHLEHPEHPEQEAPTTDSPAHARKPPRPHIPQSSSLTNTITLVHTNNQPNLSLLKYFSFDLGAPSPSHPLYHNLKSLSWLQLLSPSSDPAYIEPEILPEDQLASMKSSKRGTYYKKRRRWERTSRVVDETRRGGFDGLVVASVMDPAGVLRELVPLVRGAGKVVVYSPNVEPLVELCDFYSKERRAAWMARYVSKPAPNITTTLENGNESKSVNGNGVKSQGAPEDADEILEPLDEDFPVNPTLLLAPMLQTARARHWQVLPGRTHPLMTSKGGAEGYLFTATRVLPVEGRVEARGHGRGKKRKTGTDTAVAA